MTPRTRGFPAAVLAGVALVFAGCDGGGGGGGAKGTPVSGLEILALGGDGGTFFGGRGGNIGIFGGTGGDVRILRSGRIDASFDLPDLGNVDLGSNPLVVTVDTTIDPLAYPLQAGSADATGLHVLPGVTLTLQPSIDFGSNGTLDLVRVLLTDGVLIEGTVRIDGLDTDSGPGYDAGDDAAQLVLEAANVVVAEGGRIEATGRATTGDGGRGGEIQIVSQGLVAILGTVDTSGADAGASGFGGDGGGITLETTRGPVYCTGLVDTSGGNGAGDSAGWGGDIECFAGLGGFYLSGAFVTRGGNDLTADANGGDGGAISIFATVGPIVSSADFDTSGGDGDSDAGNAGDISVESRGGPVRMIGTMTARGGASADAFGGAGGDVFVGTLQEDLDEAEGIAFVPINEGLAFGMNVDTSGGNGDDGGPAGNVELRTFLQIGRDPKRVHHTLVLGYDRIDCSGGQGSGSVGGRGGDIEILNEVNFAGLFDSGKGSIRNEVPFFSVGGASNGSQAGDGGSATIGGAEDDEFGTEPLLATSLRFDRAVVNHGAFDLRGGSGPEGGGNGGSFAMLDHFRVENAGAVDTSGGNSTNEAAGNAGSILLLSDGVAVNRANLTALGGTSGTEEGGNGGTIAIEGRHASARGTFIADGGAGAADEGGGDGGDIVILSTGEKPSSFRGTMRSFAGAGGTIPEDKLDGNIFIDGLQVEQEPGVGFRR